MKVLLNVTEQLTAKMMENYILASGAEAGVMAASSKETLMELTATYQPDIFAYYLTDDDTIDLKDLFDQVKQIGSRTKTLLFVGKNKMMATDALADANFDECISVPFEISEVMLRLRKLFRSIQDQPVAAAPPQQDPRAVQVPPAPVAMPDFAAPQAQTAPPPTPFFPPSPAETPLFGENAEYAASPEREGFYAPPAAVSAESRQPVAYAPPAPQSERQSPPLHQPTQESLRETDLPEMVAETKVPAKNNLFKKALGFLSRALFILLIIVIAALAVLLVKSKFDGGTPLIMGYQLYGVISGSMSGNQKDSFNTGSLVFVKPIQANEIREGDIITFRGVGVNSPLTTHRVVKVNDEGGKLTFTTRGDANNVDDPNPIPAERIVGTVRGSVPLLGYLTSFAQTRTGLVFLIFIPGGFVIIYETVNIFKTIKDESKKKKDA